MLFLIQAGFVLLTVIYLYFLLNEFRKGIYQTSWDENRKKTFWIRLVFSVGGWMGFVSVWSLERMSDFSIFPFNFLPIVAIPLISAIIFSLSKTTGEILAHIPPQNLIRLQSFRIFVELLLWALFVESLIPEQMSFEGRNFDILSGLTAPVIAWLVSRNRLSKTGLIVWNVVCLGLLINIVTVAILSTPSPIRVFMNEPSNTAVTYFPVSWLPGVLVPLAYTLHFLSLRQTSARVSSPIKNLERV